MEIKDIVIKSELIDWQAAQWIQANLKEFTKQDYDKLRESLIQNNFMMPFTVWQDGDTLWILDGHHRQKVLQSLIADGYKIPERLPANFIECKDKHDAAKKVLIYSSIYAKITDEGLYEFMNVNELKLEEIKGITDLPEIDFKQFEENFYHNVGLTDEDAVPENAPAIVKRGQIWKLGSHRLMCGDSTNADDVARLMDGKKADMVFTDPPYNVAGESRNYAANVSKAMNDLKNSDWDKNFDIKMIFPILEQCMAESCSLYVCTSHFLINTIWEWMKSWSDFYFYCVWCKPNPMPSLSKRHWTWATELIAFGVHGKHICNFPTDGHALNWWNITKQKETEHPTEKPVAVPERAILFSSEVGQSILDLFCGTGSTFIVCEKTGRACYGMEIAPNYCDVIIKRWEDFTGKKAELVSEQ